MLSGPAQGPEEREKVERHFVTGDRQIERDRQPLVGDAVIVEIVLETVGAIGQRARYWRASAPPRAW